VNGTSFEVLSRSVAQTRDAGRRLAGLLSPGALVLLRGPLGAGKTELVRGLAEGLGAEAEEVASPSFALVHEYGAPAGTPLLVHADLFRLLGTGAAAPANLDDLGLAEARAGGAVVVVEWPEELPDERDAVEVTISLEDDEARRIVVRRASPDLRTAVTIRRR
jgi:tRNA threonylcarbamoyladenosine biosynthesis protein TsaE